MIELLVVVATATLVFTLVTALLAPKKSIYAKSEEPAYRRLATGWFERWHQRWLYAGYEASAKMPGWVMLGAIAGSLVVFSIVSSPLMGVAIAAAVAGSVWTFLGSRVRKRNEKITTQLEDFLDSVRGHLDGAGTIEQAIRQATKTTEAPLSNELRLLIIDLDARVTFEDALRRFAFRSPSRSAAFAAAMMDMAYTSGSQEIQTNLTELAKLINENAEMAGQIKGETMLLRVAGRMTMSLPWLIVIANLVMMNTVPAWTSTLGTFVLLGLVAATVGLWFWFRFLQRWAVEV